MEPAEIILEKTVQKMQKEERKAKKKRLEESTTQLTDLQREDKEKGGCPDL